MQAIEQRAGDQPVTPRAALDDVTGALAAWVEVDLDAIAHNARAVRRHIGAETIFYAVVKANAYGCGAVACARTLLEAGADRLAVTHVVEGRELRRHGIEAPILVMGPTLPGEMDALVAADLTPAISTVEAAEALRQAVQAQSKANYPVQIKVETGLGRTGVTPEQAPSLVQAILVMEELVIEGAFTHLATAATGDPAWVHHQARQFEQALRAMEAAGAVLPIVHLANSAATLAYPEYRWTAVRVGTLLYGQSPLAGGSAMIDVRDPWRLKARIAHVADVPAGHGVGYGRAFVTSRPTTVAVVPVGYVDGWQLEPVSVPVGIIDLLKVLAKQALAFFGYGPGRRRVRVGDQERPVLGKVAMQFTMIDVTGMDVCIGDPVELPARRTVIRPDLPRVWVASGAAEQQEKRDER
ncbi:alanine racemase [Heliophilum fasciatum]|uniref:Alanine racemase n=1 Tax=Heliophilum fasciatum TaxID=35700 RepID=A0A4R2S1J0_9FIRM|nr:alanine racemase [Heliophilum fasciatum]MCW2277504.1 alanine racemase [Heliophilum fasciatum]TCP65205.1 alanine racemase [Heliophilum fasciatum]